MTQRTETYDDEKWQLVPKKHDGKAGLTDHMMRAFYNNFDFPDNKRRGSFERLNAAYNALLASAPPPPVAAPIEVVGLEPDHRQEVCPRCEGWGVINVFGIEETWNESCPECRGDALAQRGEKK